MNLVCTNCKTLLLSENMNIATDLGKGMNCDAIFKLSELVEQEKVEVSSIPPVGSNVTLNSSEDGILIITLPKNGFNKAQIPRFGFSIVWLGFVAFWTTMAIQGGLFFALFSIPFWFTGFLMLYGLLKTALASQRITVSQTSINLEHINPLKSKTQEIEISNIQEITFEQEKQNPYTAIGKRQFSKSKIKNDTDKASTEVPTIITYADKKTFFETANLDEQIWATSLLNDIVKKLNN